MRYLPTVIISLIYFCSFSCGSKHQIKESDQSIQYYDELIGDWLLVEYESTKPIKLNDTVRFNTNGTYYRSLNESGEWSYKYINPDSLIIYNKDFGEQRFRVIELSKDSLILQLKENVTYGDTIYKETFDEVEKYIRLN